MVRTEGRARAEPWGAAVNDGWRVRRSQERKPAEKGPGGEERGEEEEGDSEGRWGLKRVSWEKQEKEPPGLSSRGHLGNRLKELSQRRRQASLTRRTNAGP